MHLVPVRNRLPHRHIEYLHMKNPQETLVEGFFEHAPSLTRRCYLKINNRALAEDLVQETFIKTWLYLTKSKTSNIESMKAFLFHVLNNLIIDEYRKRKALSLEALSLNGFEPSVNDTDKIISTLDGKQAAELIKELPPKYRRAVSMRYLQDMSLSEMAEQTNQSKNAVTVQVCRGLGKLKMNMQLLESHA